MFCKNCGKEITDETLQYCLGCGCRIEKANEITCGKNWLYTFILNWMLGCFGAHRFYTGYIAIGIVQLLTLGGCGIWSLIDMVMLGLNNFKNAQDEELIGYNNIIGMVGIAYASLLVFCVLLMTIMLLAIAFFIASQGIQ